MLYISDKLEFITITLIYLKYEELRDRLTSLLCVSNQHWSTQTGDLKVNKIFQDEQTMSGAVNRRIAVCPFSETRSILLSNMIDCCESIVKSINPACNYIRVSVSRSNDPKTNPFYLFESRIDDCHRIVLTYWDSNKWVFYQAGDPMTFEKVECYKRRRIADRLNLSLILQYLISTGWNVDTHNVFLSEIATYFIESHPNKRPFK